jgi:hypothetical protein
MRRPVRYPAAGPEDLAKWRRLVGAVLAAISGKADTRPLMRARKATWSRCAMPRGHAFPGNDFLRLGQEALRWTSSSPVQRQDLGPALKARAEACRDHLDAIDNSRRRADLED